MMKMIDFVAFVYIRRDMGLTQLILTHGLRTEQLQPEGCAAQIDKQSLVLTLMQCPCMHTTGGRKY